MATTPLTPQDIADCVNTLGITKDAFTVIIKAASLLVQRNTIQAQILAASAAANTAGTDFQSKVAALQAQINSIDQQYASLVLVPGA